MTNEILEKKTTRYLFGEPMPAEAKQLQNWLSCTAEYKPVFGTGEREQIEKEILEEVQSYTAYPLFYPKKKAGWWERFWA
jgi:hypothetical protein